MYKSTLLIWRKADGSYVMTCISGSTSSGMTLSEAAYFMKEIGCVNAWDFDGGGSATIIARNDEGKSILLIHQVMLVMVLKEELVMQY